MEARSFRQITCCPQNRMLSHRWTRHTYLAEINCWYAVCEHCHRIRLHNPAEGSALFTPNGKLLYYKTLHPANFNPNRLADVLKKAHANHRGKLGHIYTDD